VGPEGRDTCEFQLALEALSKRSIPRALDLLNRAERRGHDPNQCAAQRWLCWMLLGRFENAWQESDRVTARGRPDPNRYWDGLPFTGKHVIIRCLHGYGDAIQFIRYARLVRREASRITVQTHPELVSLLSGVSFVDDVITWQGGTGEGAGSWEQQIEIMELPRAFRTKVDTIPNHVPYLRVPPERLERRRVPARRAGKPRVGLQWGASDWNAARSITLRELRPILDVAGLTFYSFQRGAAREELSGFDAGGRIYDVAGESPAIVEAAADLMNIDLLITVDTMLAHLAGALGKPVWVLLPYEADWRWMLGRRDSPWYPTMTLFRQTCPGDWTSPVRQLAAELRNRD
jgi:hypothetical protein